MEAAPQKGAATPQEKSPHRIEKGAASPTLLGSQGSNHSVSVLASDEGREKKKEKSGLKFKRKFHAARVAISRTISIVLEIAEETLVKPAARSVLLRPGVLVEVLLVFQLTNCGRTPVRVAMALGRPVNLPHR